MAQFVSALSSSLSGYIPPGDGFVNYLNMALPRLYSLGYWRDLVFEYTISTDTNYFYIPREAESVMSAVIEGYPVDLNARWQDYKTSGRYEDSPNYLYGAVDDGLQSTKFEFDGTTKYQLKVVPVTPEVVLPTYGAVYVTYVKSNSQKVIHKFQLNGSASIQTAFTDANQVVDVELVRFEGLTAMVDVQLVSGATSFSLAEGRGDEIARYRWYRFANPNSDEKHVVLLLKRKFNTLLFNTDIVYLSNINAIKHALLGIVAEDNADMERSAFHWGTCKQLLDEEKDAFNGMARPKVQLDPMGKSGHSLYNMM